MGFLPGRGNADESVDSARLAWSGRGHKAPLPSGISSTTGS